MTEHTVGLMSWLESLRLPRFPKNHPIHAFYDAFPWETLGALVDVKEGGASAKNDWMGDGGLTFRVLQEGKLTTFEFAVAPKGPHSYAWVRLVPTYMSQYGNEYQEGLRLLTCPPAIGSGPM